MSSAFDDRVLALAGIAQALQQVRRIAETGHSDAAVARTAMDSVLRLDALPQPADAADALAIALCHAWRRGTAVPGSGEALTPAQRAWADAERAASRR